MKISKKGLVFTLLSCMVKQLRNLLLNNNNNKNFAESIKAPDKCSVVTRSGSSVRKF